MKVCVVGVVVHRCCFVFVVCGGGDASDIVGERTVQIVPSLMRKMFQLEKYEYTVLYVCKFVLALT